MKRHLPLLLACCAVSALTPLCAARGQARSHTLARLGFPKGLSLEGSAERTVAFRLPGNAPVDSARLDLRVHFPPAAIPQSNVQIFVNDVRRAVLSRSNADSSGTVVASVRLPGVGLGADYVSVRFRPSVAAVSDRCLDERIGLSFVEIDRNSSFTYFSPAAAITDVRQAWAALPDTATITLPGRPLTPDELSAVLAVAAAAQRDGHVLAYKALPQVGDVVIAPANELSALPGFTMVANSLPSPGPNLGVFRVDSGTAERRGLFIDPQRGQTAASFLAAVWTPLTAVPSANVRTARALDTAARTQTLQELGFTDLSRLVGSEADWRIPLDLGAMPPGRVPARVRLRLSTAPNTGDRQLVTFLFLNGVLVRAADAARDGVPQTIEAALPSATLTMRNELRVLLQRRTRGADVCAGGTSVDTPLPAQLLPTSEVETVPTDARVRTFSGVAAAISSAATLYVPRAALSQAAEYLPVLTAIGHAFWRQDRAPRLAFYDAGAPPAPPAGPFVVIGRPPSVSLAGAVSSDSGRLRIRRKDNGETLLDVSDLRGWSVVQVVNWNGQQGVQVLPATTNSAVIPDWPDAYGNNTLTIAGSDSSIFSLNTADRQGSLLFNDGPTIVDRIRADWLLWSLFAVLLVVPILFVTVRAIVRRTPRRRVPPRVSRPPARPSASGAPPR